MTAKQYLMQIYRLNRHIDSLIAEKDRLMRIVEGVSGVSYDKVKVQAARTTSGNAQTDAVYKLVDLEERITDKIDKYVDMREEAARVIDRMPQESERELLRYRYLCSMKWDEIAEKMNVDPRTVYKIHGRALLSFVKVMPHEL